MHVMTRAEESKRRRGVRQKVDSNDRMRQMIAGMAHHYNNLHAIIQGHADLLLEKLAEKDPARRDIETMRAAAGRAALITHRLTAAAEKLVLRPARFRMNDLLEALRLELVRLAGPGKQVEIRLSAEDSSVMADAPHIRQVVLDLARNAFDAIDGQGMLTIELANLDLDDSPELEKLTLGDKPFVTVSMTDTGQGMSDEALERLFEPFYTTKQSAGAAGLGLLASRGILRQSGGQLWLRSTSPRGSTFTFALPRSPQEVDPDRHGEGADEESSGETESVTVLIVEDDDTHRSLIRHVLRRQGWEVLEAKNGKEALMLCDFHRSDVDLILSDITMPEMGGIEFQDRLVQLHPQIPIVFMSGYTYEMLTDRGTLLPGTEFVQKPFNTGVLLDTLRRSLRQRCR